MKTVTVVMVVLLLSTQVVMAGNGADVDLFYRPSKAPCLKVGNDVTATWKYGTAPLTKDVSVMFYDWNATSGKKLDECGITVKTSTSTLVGVVVDNWTGSKDKVNVLLDHTKNATSIVLLAPVDDPDKAILGLRHKIDGSVTAYGKFCPGAKPQMGLSYVKDFTVDWTYGDKVTQLKLSKTFRSITPEVRMRFTPSEDYYGWAVAKKF